MENLIGKAETEIVTINTDRSYPIIINPFLMLSILDNRSNKIFNILLNSKTDFGIRTTSPQ